LIVSVQEGSRAALVRPELSTARAWRIDAGLSARIKKCPPRGRARGP
jgi:hypothetical protein